MATQQVNSQDGFSMPRRGEGRYGRREVTCRSRSLAAIALVVAVVAATGSTLIAQSARACEMKHHECHHTAAITPCCGDHANDAANQGGPVESTIQLTVDLCALPLALAAVFVDTSGTSLRIHTSQAPAFPSDLATRFAPLLV